MRRAAARMRSMASRRSVAAEGWLIGSGPDILGTGTMFALLLALLPAAQSPAPIVPKSWLVIEPVDKAGRRPLRPDAVFGKHLLARDAAAPVKGEVLRGENEKDCAWTEAAAKDDGTLEGKIGWAYTAIDAA